MRSCISFLLLSLVASTCCGLEIQFPDCDGSTPADPQLPENVSWVDPRIRGGKMLDARAPYTICIGICLLKLVQVSGSGGEPLNVIISGASNPEILTETGILKYARSIGFSNECLGLHIGGIQTADLGDGLGMRGEQLLLRQTFRRHIPFWGTTCWESFAGGNHFRGWRQNGTQANTGAWFLAASKEKTGYKDNHAIVPDGYNIGRDLLVQRALAPDAIWKAEVAWVQGLIEPGIKGINHRIPVDGLVAVITVGDLKHTPAPWRSLWSVLRVLFPFLPL